MVVEGSSAVDELLLGKRSEVTVVLDHGVSLESTDGGEGPARSALALVLDW